MDSIIVKVNDHITLNKGLTPDEGEIIFSILSDEFLKGNKVVLDFSGVEILTTAFLNVAIGNLYRDYTSAQLKELLSFNEDLPDSIALKIKQVTTAAKKFYLDEDEFNNIIDSALNEHN